MKPRIPPALLGAVLAALVALIAPMEGLRTRTYLDPVGIPTVCYGETGPKAAPGATYTPAECETMLRERLAREFIPGVLACTTRPPSMSQLVALVSFAYNVGVRATCGSTLMRLHNAGDCKGAAAEFDRWVRAGGKILPGLQTRRDAEQSAYLWGCENGE